MLPQTEHELLKQLDHALKEMAFYIKQGRDMSGLQPKRAAAFHQAFQFADDVKRVLWRLEKVKR